MARVLVTGAAGFIGSHLCEALARAGHEVTGIDFFLSDLYSAEQKRENWNQVIESSPSIKLLEIDLRKDLESKIFVGFEFIFHLAAMPGLSLSWTNFSLYSECNILATNNLLKSLDHGSLKKFLYISTSSVYGEIVDGNEDTTLKPISPYGVTKLAGEHLLYSYSNSYGFDYSILRLFSVYGPRQRADMAFNIFIHNINSGAPIYIFGDGSKSRANTYVLDVVDGLIRAMNYSKNKQIYNICGNEVYSVLEIIDSIEKIVGKKGNLKFTAERNGDQKSTLSVGSKARLELGFNPNTNLVDGLISQCEWQMTMK